MDVHLPLLTSERIARMLDFAANLAQVPSESDFSQHLVCQIQALMPDAIIGFDEIQESTGKYRLTHSSQFSPAIVTQYFPILTELYQQNPIYHYLQRKDAASAVRVSDISSRQRFENTGLYRDFFRPLGIQHQLHLVIPTAGWITSLSINGDADFSDEEVEVLHHLAPLIARQHARFNSSGTLETRFRAFGLSAREGQVLQWISEGKRNAEIAVILELSERTVEKHVANILRKLPAENRTCAARLWAASGGLGADSSPIRGRSFRAVES